MSTKFHLRALSILFCSLAVVGLAFAGSTPEVTTSEVREITLPLDGDPGIIDPVANWLGDIAGNMFVPLVEYDYETSKVIPAGATSWKVSADGKTWTFEIRKNWKRSNGDSVTAKDYEYGFRAIVDPETASPVAWRLFGIQNASAVNAGDMPLESLGVKATGDYTLEIKIDAPATWFLSSLTSVGHAVPQASREQYGLDWTQPGNIVVNGPFILTKWEQDDILVLEKNPSYYNAGAVEIDKITLLIVPEASTAMAMYENGELDSTDVPPEDLDRVRSDSVLGPEFYNGPRFVLYWYGFASHEPPTDNVLVRKALAAATDKQTIVDQITRGGQVAAGTMTPPGSVGHVDPSAGIGIPFDVAQAKKYLAEAGYPGGEGLPPVMLGYNANEINANIAQAVQKMWSDNLGVTVELKGWEGGGYNDAVSAGAFNVWRNGWGMDFPDAHNVLGEIFRSKPFSGDASHSILLTIPEFDEIIDTAAVESDPAKRNEMYQEAEKILVEDYASAMPLYWYAVNRVTKPRVNRPNVPSFNQSWWLWSVND
ncbi:MAG: peptide ABC transporter substrate-binding protein [Lysobacterales bacterium]|nr:MAG: peptide ABC transporter substrate-binding protein [Xanthomonadales bacterium]